ncbi:hypothetical protein DSAG12_01021 [Promethearchaeum syntrophicum]|uniref:Uncharacterized protein n=1 Tax=Promethearchaeum syntrophicum TaxID=2594042 RepID=A0A5B9D8I2_9ARCH|nr:hypothetical protein [Candidatus Prometheoarchaeum syntrophicum]QEE15197.1 hypothetical protein DSAG12_01021 [Candidatus Prometheoarchaeum syntrophicum]
MKTQKKPENIGAFISNCGGCGRKFLAGYIIRYTPGIFSSCLHCYSDMCVRCDKGALCADCFNIAPKEVQKSCLRNRNVFKSIYWFFIAFLLAIILFSLIFVLILHMKSFENYPVLLVLVYIGAFGWLPAFIIMKLGYKWWYKNHKHEL